MRNDKLILIARFCKHHDIEPSVMMSMHEFGLLQIIKLNEEHYLSMDDLGKAEKIIRLHNELGINFEGIDVINTLLKKIENLQQELMVAKNRLINFAPDLLNDDKNQLNH